MMESEVASYSSFSWNRYSIEKILFTPLLKLESALQGFLLALLAVVQFLVICSFKW